MKWAFAVFANNGSKIHCHVNILEAINRFEATGKAYKIGEKLYPGYTTIKVGVADFNGEPIDPDTVLPLVKIREQL